ncbi:MAG: hypothetical protein R3229_15925 [Alphaproteobacteria bacterium]|nr:hypothetical protein [Alphaproteobacteria bacterium]
MGRETAIGSFSGAQDARGLRAALGQGEGAVNRAIGFSSLLLCVVSGMVLGLWSFVGPIPVPEFIGAYDELPRRLLRLGHIAFFGLGMINLALAGQARRLPFTAASRARALALMNLGNIGLPPLLIAAAWVPALVYLAPFPVFCVFLSLCLAAGAAWRGCLGGNAARDGA